MFFENIKEAITSIFSNKMRSLLTMLGIIIGISSVIDHHHDRRLDPEHADGNLKFDGRKYGIDLCGAAVSGNGG